MFTMNETPTSYWKTKKNGIGKYNDWNIQCLHEKCYELYVTFKYIEKIILINISMTII